jgi:flagellar protein FlaF
MPNPQLAARAYTQAAANKSIRAQEADIFLEVTARLRAAGPEGPIARVRALGDNRRLWMLVSDLVRDGNNQLPPETRAGLVSIGLAVQREMESETPNFDFLISINRHIAEGLSGNP